MGDFSLLVTGFVNRKSLISVSPFCMGFLFTCSGCAMIELTLSNLVFSYFKFSLYLEYPVKSLLWLIICLYLLFMGIVAEISIVGVGFLLFWVVTFSSS